MVYLILLAGIVVAAVGLIGMVSPAGLIGFMTRMPSKPRFWMAVIVRVAFGVIFLAGAEACRWAPLIRVLGVITLVAGVLVLIMGERRLNLLIERWTARPIPFMRVWCLFPVAFGAVLIWAAWPAVQS